MKASKKVPLKNLFSYSAPLVKTRQGVLEFLDNMQKTGLDLTSYLTPEPDNFYVVRVNGESMINENIHDGDVLIVEKGNNPSNNQIIIAALNGELTVKRYRIIEDKVYLFSANEKFLPIEIFPMFEFSVQGIVRHVIKTM